MLQAAAQLQPHPYQAVIEPRQPSPLQGAGKQAAGGITATPEMGARGAGVATGERILATEDNQAQGKELKDGDISGIIQQAVDMCSDKFIDLVEDEQVRSSRRFGKSLAELEAKWEEKIVIQAEGGGYQEEGSRCGGRICNNEKGDKELDEDGRCSDCICD